MSRLKFSILLMFFAVFLLADYSSLFCVQAAESEQLRRVYFVRHGQRPGGGGDPALTDLGVEQARLLGMRLKADGFSGTIYASPYLRTVQTACEVAKILDAKVILNPLIQERTHPNYAPIKGLSFEELCGSFGDLIDRKVPLKYPWVYTDNIGNTLVNRVKEALDAALKSGNADILFVGHKATVNAAIEIMCKSSGCQMKDLPIYNCMIFCFTVGKDGKFFFTGLTADFLKPSQTTDNFKAVFQPADTKE